MYMLTILRFSSFENNYSDIPIDIMCVCVNYSNYYPNYYANSDWAKGHGVTPIIC